jgi:hypothetical protein
MYPQGAIQLAFWVYWGFQMMLGRREGRELEVLSGWAAGFLPSLRSEGNDKESNAA